MNRVASFLIAALLLAGITAAAVDGDAAEKRWWTHILYLADDKLEGRNTGSPGYKLAAQYVASQFKDAGLEPTGTAGYLQDLAFDVRQIDEAQSSWEIERNGQRTRVELGPDATMGVRGEPGDSIDASAVFVGYGFAVPELGYDELAGLDLHGRISVLLAGGPSSIPGPLKAHYQSGAERWKALRKAGAIGVVTIPNPRTSDIPWERSSLIWTEPGMFLADPTLDETRGLKFTGTINPARADRFLDGSGHSIAELLALADAGKPLPKFPLAVTFHARIALKRSQVTSPNVIGVLPGADPQLKSEYVVISAHLDHLGVGKPINNDRIYNGAMDNASGVASLIEIAKSLSTAPDKPKRSILFAAVTGEEKGELGSQYFVAHPTVNIKNIVADINMDMYLPLFPLKYLEVQGLGESTLGDDIRAVSQANGIEVQSDKQPAANRFIRSDQYSFIKAGIPALAFKFGWVPGSPEEKIFNDWLRTRYHAPSDDVAQPVDLAAAAQFNRIVEQLAVRVAGAPTRPSWYEGSFFRRFAQ
jgi:Zn-dependent M28 family amino/carboxypeptidase